MAITPRKLAYYDEVATLSDATPEAVDGTAASAGTAEAASRADHIHALGPLVAALDCDQQEIQQAVIHKLAEAPGDLVLAQVYFLTSDEHLYVGVTAT